LHAGCGLPVGAMLPLSVRLRATSPTFEERVAGGEDWASRCEGFRLDGPSGRLGTVQSVVFDPASGAPAWLQIRTGLFVRRSGAIPIEDIESIDPLRHRMTVTTLRFRRDLD
jgi:hypothetical protein